MPSISFNKGGKKTKIEAVTFRSLTSGKNPDACNYGAKGYNKIVGPGAVRFVLAEKRSIGARYSNYYDDDSLFICPAAGGAQHGSGGSYTGLGSC